MVKKVKQSCDGTLVGFQTLFPKHEFKTSNRGNIVRKYGKKWLRVCIHNTLLAQCKGCKVDSKHKFLDELEKQLECSIERDSGTADGFISHDKLTNELLKKHDHNKDIVIDFLEFDQKSIREVEQKFTKLIFLNYVVFYVWKNEYQSNKGTPADICRRFVNKLEY